MAKTLLKLFVAALLSACAFGASAGIATGYTLLNGNYFKISDGSGPYSIASDGTITLMTSGSGGGGGGAVTQSGTWTVQPGNTANTTAWKIDGSAVTQPVSSATLATAAKQSDGSAKNQIVDGSGNVIGATSNALDVNIKSGGTGGGAVTNAGTFAVQPAGSVAHDAAAGSINPILTGCYSSAAAPTGVSADADSVRAWCLANGARVIQTTFAGVLASTGSGNVGTGVQRITIATDDAAIAALIAAINAANSQLPSALGTGADSVGLLTVWSTEAKAQIGSLTETAPSTDTALSGLNGRLQRLAQKWVAQASTTSGQPGLLIQCATTTSAPTYTTGQTNPCSTDTTGAIRVTGGGGGTQYTEDAAAAADPVGGVIIGIRRDTLSVTEVSADGDNVAIKATSKGQLHVAQEDGTAIASASCSASCNATTLLSADMTGFESITYQMVAAGTGTVTFQTSEDNATWVSAMCHNVSLTGGSTTIAATLASTTGLVKCPKYGRYARLQFTAYTSGTFTAQGGLHKSPYLVTGSAYVPTSVTVTGSLNGAATIPTVNLLAPGTLGARTATPTAVATGQIIVQQGTTDGKTIVLQDSIPEITWSYPAATSGIVNTTTAVTIKAAGTDRLYLRTLDLMCEALGTATEVAIRDGAGGTVLYKTKVGTGGLTNGRTINFLPPLRGTSATLMEVVTLTASGTGACYVNASGYDAK